MLFFLIPIAILAYIFIGCVLTGLYDRTDGIYGIEPPHYCSYSGDRAFKTGFGIALWPFLGLYLLVCTIGHSPYLFFRKVHSISKEANPWDSWKTYVTRKSS